MSLLEQFIILHLSALILTFVRLGTAVMMMPGAGDSFVPARIRFFFAFALSVVVMPIVATHLPSPLPQGAAFLSMIVIEFLVGAFIGTFARVIMSATDTAGMIVSFQAGLSNAQLFNPMMAGQGSLIGAFFSITAAALLFVTNMHHLLLAGLINSYDRFPLGQVPNIGNAAETITDAVGAAFIIACQMSAPFLILILLLYAAMGLLSKLMPQLQIFILAMPVQVMISLILMFLTTGAMLMFFVTRYGETLSAFLGG